MLPAPGESGPCEDPECRDVCVIKTCDDKNSYQLVQKVGPSNFRTFTDWTELRIQGVNDKVCYCPELGAQAPDIAELKDGFLLTTFKTGKVYISYQGAMENAAGELLVLDQPYCNEYYEYAIKQRILENMVFNGGKCFQSITACRNKIACI